MELFGAISFRLLGGVPGRPLALDTIMLMTVRRPDIHMELFALREINQFGLPLLQAATADPKVLARVRTHHAVTEALTAAPGSFAREAIRA